MPEWLFTGLVVMGSGLIGTAGVIIGAVISARTSKEANAATADAAAKNDTQVLVDQLQEELKGYRNSQEARATEQDARMNRLEEYSNGYRSHAHELRSHIWNGSPPPPPEWPENLPR